MLKDFVKITAGPDRAEANYTEVFRAIETATGEGLDQFARGLLVGVVCRAPDETDDQFRRRVRAQYKIETFVDRYGVFGGMGASEFRRASKAPSFSDPVRADVPPTIENHAPTNVQAARYTSDGWTSAVTAELRRRERERAPRVQPDYPDDNWPHAGER
jgi:hypothetical protein